MALVVGGIVVRAVLALIAVPSALGWESSPRVEDPVRVARKEWAGRLRSRRVGWRSRRLDWEADGLCSRDQLMTDQAMANTPGRDRNNCSVSACMRLDVGVPPRRGCSDIAV